MGGADSVICARKRVHNFEATPILINHTPILRSPTHKIVRGPTFTSNNRLCYDGR